MLVTIIAGVAINAGLGFWFYYAHKNLKTLEATYAKQQVSIKDLKNVVEVEGPVLEATLKRLQRDLATKESKLPELDDVEQMIYNMSKIAESTGAILKAQSRVGGDAAVPGASYTRTIWKTSWTADFMSWCKLLNAMEERFPRFIAFENLRISPPNNGMVPTGIKHEISVDVVAYRYLRSK
jgi:Tfp pilus assembly protein PilO